MDIKAVIFDFGGVFIDSPVNSFARYEKERGMPHRFIGTVIKQNEHDNAWAKLERSEVTGAEFDGLFAEESKAMGHEVRGKVLLSLFSNQAYHENMIRALSCIQKAGFKTGCITNNMAKGAGGWDVEAAHAGRSAEIMRTFDHVIESAKAGVRKPEPRIYEMMCEALDVEPQACIFVDDLGVNLKPALAMGMKTVKVPFEDVSPAVAELAEMTGLSF